MSTIKRLKELQAIRYWKTPLSTDGYSIRGDHLFASIVNIGSGGPEMGELMVEATNALQKLLAFVDAWDDCQTVTANQVEKMSILLSARKALDEEPK